MREYHAGVVDVEFEPKLVTVANTVGVVNEDRGVLAIYPVSVKERPLTIALIGMAVLPRPKPPLNSNINFVTTAML